jgi:hypothetical protein
MIKLTKLERNYPLAEEKYLYILRDITVGVEEACRRARPNFGAVQAVWKGSMSNRDCSL